MVSNPAPPVSLFQKLKPFWLQLYRLAVLAMILVVIRDHHVRVRIHGDKPITLAEIEGFFPKAARLRADHSERAGMHVLGLDGNELGYVVRTSPVSDKILGYAGPTDTLIAFDNELKVLGIKIRRSEDTHTHVGDVASDRYFMKSWNSMNWDQVANLDLQKAGIEGVSGATKTSMAMAEGISLRLKRANEQLAHRQPLRIQSRDVVLAVVVVIAVAFSFTHVHGRKWFRRAFQAGVLIYVGVINGDLIAQSLLAGWAKSGVPWQTAPGLLLFVAAALVIPWAAGKPVYCLHVCPHGAAQEWLGRVTPARWRLHLHADLANGLRWLPPLLLAAILIIVMLALPIDLVDLEPFDAYLIRSAGWATITVAVIGLLASAFVPQAYCKYGCPTGALLEFVRSHGTQDNFGKRDIAAGLMLALVALLYSNYDAINLWIMGPL